MRVLRGRAEDGADDDAVIGRLLDEVADAGEPALRVWRPPRQVSFGRRDVRADGYEAARAAADELGFPPRERDAGGRAVAYAGPTVAFALVEPVDGIRADIGARYDRVATAVQRSLWRLGVPAQRGAPPRSFCPGGRALQWEGKLAGFAQRVRQGAALVGGLVIVSEREAIAEVLDAVYDALGLPFDQDTVGSLERAGGRTDPAAIEREIADALSDAHADTRERTDREG